MVDDVKLFLEYITVELGLSPNTKQAYVRDIELFQEILGHSQGSKSLSYQHCS